MMRAFVLLSLAGACFASRDAARSAQLKSVFSSPMDSFRSIFSDVDELTVQLPSLLSLDRLRMPRLSITPLLDMNIGLRHSPFAFRGSVPSLSLIDETPQAYTYQIQLPVGSSGVVDDKDVDVAVSHDKMLRIRYASNDGDAMGGSLSILEIVEQLPRDADCGCTGGQGVLASADANGLLTITVPRLHQQQPQQEQQPREQEDRDPTIEEAPAAPQPVVQQIDNTEAAVAEEQLEKTRLPSTAGLKAHRTKDPSKTVVLTG
ncbi:unnamed protein product [Vitrella brassicaformis CCMP3155]|uniref:SHSP domain-containing protein n=1 Tax=Vitrella brassicaformis (strain CCMP3155) TaxID=1169540 RepID=A0A0G4EGD4_VITBC|nr:unnamed protein product [Vitrella brassicaformis CCMP3155]|eukprot:CEL94757.1 unnamed protein product [Vitrella brassicaformis CCMP3155]